jgi:hypothetical protein
MNPLTLRKLILIGIESTGTAPLLNSQGMPATPLDRPVKMRIAMWIPQPTPFQRCEGTTAVPGAMPHELQALRDGAIVEEIFDFNYPKQPTLDTLRRELLPIWEKRTLEVLGFVPNDAPIDRDPKPEIRFSAV